MTKLPSEMAVQQLVALFEKVVEPSELSLSKESGSPQVGLAVPRWFHSLALLPSAT